MVQSYYTDGTTITTWDELNNQVLISNATQNGDNIFEVLTDFTAVSEKYSLSIKEERKDAYVFSVAPTEKLPFDKLELTLTKENLFVSQIYYSDKQTGTVQVDFSNISLNKALEDDVFNFKTPEGAQVMDLRE